MERASYGDGKFQAELFNSFVAAVRFGVLLVFAILALLYKRVMPPFVNMGSLLLAPLGGAFALHLAGMSITMPLMIGVLMLLGIVAKTPSYWSISRSRKCIAARPSSRRSWTPGTSACNRSS